MSPLATATMGQQSLNSEQNYSNGSAVSTSDSNCVQPTLLSARRLLGEHEAGSLAGAFLVNNFHKLEQLNPALGRHFVENLFGSNMNHTIEHREWAIVVVAVLIAIGDTTDQLQVYVGAALKHGATEAELIDIINLVSNFTGAPRAVNGIRRIADTLTATRKHDAPQPEERIVRLHDHDTLVRDSHGNGPPIVLIHCLSLDSHQWSDVFPQLSKVARVITYDLRGHGQARAAPLTRSLNHLAEDLRELLDILGIEKADIYGASYGGAVAQYFTLAYPGRVRSLAVIATAAQGNEVLYSRATRAEANGVQSLLSESIIRWFLPETIAEDPWFVRYARQCVRRARVEDWASSWKAMAALDCIDRLGEIKVPTLILCGKQDLSTPPSVMKPQFEGLPYGEYVELDPGTHMMVMEQAEAATAELTAFRQRVDVKQD